MERLSDATAARLPGSIGRPGYDRSRLRTGILHVGVGAFHRCHQADFAEDLAEAGHVEWAIEGINLRLPRISDRLQPQQGLYVRRLTAPGSTNSRLIGCLRSATDASDDWDSALSLLARPDIDVVTLTITEKGYCHVPATGRLDRFRPEVAVDLAGSTRALTAPGFLVDALERRRRLGGGPLTLVSCDNVAGNGRVLERALRELAQTRAPALAGWIDRNVAFPSTMVDRIVPATSDRDLEAFADETGLRDEGLVVGEPFRQWIVEDRFAGRRPPWEMAGASFVSEVEPFEFTKMRILNAAQSALASLGLLCGLTFTWQAVADPVLGGWTEALLRSESASTVTGMPGLPTPDYIALALRRIANDTISHRCGQIATDGTQKLVQRFVAPYRMRLVEGRSVRQLGLAIASLLACLCAAAPAFGARWRLDDPFADAIRDIAQAESGDAASLAARLLGLEALFGRDLATSPLREELARHLPALLGEAPRDHVRREWAAAADGVSRP
jgi:fructuronate reductase